MISHDVLASYAADAALEVDGVAELTDGPRRHRGVRVTETDGTFALEVHLALDWGARAPEIGTAVQRRVAEYLVRMAKLPSVAVDVVVDDVGRRACPRASPGSPARRSASAPSVCRDCVWWQSRGNKTASKERWIERAEEEWGEWGTIYLDDDGRAARIDAVRPVAVSSRGPRTCRPAPRRTTRSSSPARTSSGTAPSGSRSRCSSRRSASPATGARAPSRRSRTATRRARRRGAVPRPPDGLPARLPRRVRLHDPPRRRGAWSSAGSTSAVSLPVEEGRRAKVLRVVQEAFTPTPAPVPPAVDAASGRSPSRRPRTPVPTPSGTASRSRAGASVSRSTPNVSAWRATLLGWIVPNGRSPCPPVPTTNERIPCDRREALVVVIVAAAARRRRAPRRGGLQNGGEPHVGAVEPGAEPRVVPVRERAACFRWRARSRPQPAPLAATRRRIRRPRSQFELSTTTCQAPSVVGVPASRRAGRRSTVATAASLPPFAYSWFPSAARDPRHEASPGGHEAVARTRLAVPLSYARSPSSATVPGMRGHEGGGLLVAVSTSHEAMSPTAISVAVGRAAPGAAEGEDAQRRARGRAATHGARR